MSKATHYFHGIRILNRLSRFSVWFNGDPTGPTGSLATFVDGERFDRLGRSYALTDAEIDALLNGPWSARQRGVFNPQIAASL
jgi:hypothetical protein